MTYATLMVHVQAGQSNAGALAIAGDLAERLQASVIVREPLFAGVALTIACL
jgi:hypothetical protein